MTHFPAEREQRLDRQVSELLAQRDELLGLLQDAIATIGERDLKNTAPKWLARAKTVIAKAEGK